MNKKTNNMLSFVLEVQGCDPPAKVVRRTGATDDDPPAKVVRRTGSSAGDDLIKNKFTFIIHKWNKNEIQ